MSTWSFRFSPRAGLGLFPQLVELGERRALEGTPLFCEASLDVVKTIAEAPGGHAKLPLGIDAQVAGEIDGREQQVADLARGGRGVFLAHGALDFGDLLADLGHGTRDFR